MRGTTKPECPYVFGDRTFFCVLAEQQAKVAEAAKTFAAVTAGLENTPEGAALLAALKEWEEVNDE